jgi:O-antigen/teichoic acid export membrane protein
MGPLSQGIIRFYAPAFEKKALFNYFSAVRKIVFSGIFFVVFIMVFIVFWLTISKNAEWIPLVIAAFIFAIFNACNSVLNGIQNAARQRSVVALHQGAAAWLRFLLAAVFMFLLWPTSTIVLTGYAIASILIVLSQFIFLRKIISGIKKKSNEIKWSSQIWKFSWPFSVWGLFTWGQLASSRWCLEFFSTTYEVGLYAVLFQLGYYPVATITQITSQFFAPIFYQKSGDASDSKRNAQVQNMSWRLTISALFITAGVFLVAFCWHSQIFKIFTAEKYHRVSYLFPWMILAGGVFAAGQSISLNLMSLMKTYDMMAAKICTAVLGIVFNFAGAYFYGIKGIVIAGVLFSVIYFIWMNILAKKFKVIVEPIS